MQLGSAAFSSPLKTQGVFSVIKTIVSPRSEVLCSKEFVMFACELQKHTLTIRKTQKILKVSSQGWHARVCEARGLSQVHYIS